MPLAGEPTSLSYYISTTIFYLHVSLIFNTDGTGVPSNTVADAIDFARRNGADIISNSWSYNSSNPNLVPVIVEEIDEATTSGRGGLGCIVVFAAGNTARRTVGDNGVVNFPSNVNITGVLSVGASDRNDQQADYSPSSNPGGSNNQIQEVFNIITESADEVGGYAYTNGVSNELGHGRLNALEAIREAINGEASISGPSLVCTSSSSFSIANLPLGLTATWSVSPAYLVATASGTGTTANLQAASTSSSGEATITFTLNGGCDNITISKDFWVGPKPVIPLLVSQGNITDSSNPENIYIDICVSFGSSTVHLDLAGVQNLQASTYSGSQPQVVNTSVYWSFPSSSYSGSLRLEYDVDCGSVTQFIIFNNTIIRVTLISFLPILPGIN